ncbi:MAG: DNA-directed RNA polymerase subunit beta [Elusimicrobiota bacterium]
MKKVDFSRITTIAEQPNLIELQKRSFLEFLQEKTAPEKRKIQGLQAAFMDVFPIPNGDETLSLEFVSYLLDTPRYSPEECKTKDITYAAPVKAKLRLLAKEEGGKIKEISEQEVYMADMPLMSENATFIINGAERIVVSQLHRSPGVIFEEDEEKKISSYGKPLFFARMIPYRGAWVEFEFDLNNILYVRIDKKRKFPATLLLRAMGIEKDSAILALFYEIEEKSLAHGPREELAGRVLAEDVIDQETGEVLWEANKELTKEALAKFENKIKKIKLLQLDPTINNVAIRLTLSRDTIKTKKEALYEIYRKMRAQEFIAPEQAESYLDNLIFKGIRRYDLTAVGRYKINKKLADYFAKLEKMPGFDFHSSSERKRNLTPEDIIATIKYLVDLNNGIGGEVDDIDHLGNRRVRAVGELLENQVRMGLSQMARLVRDKMNMQDRRTITPRSVVNSAPVIGIIRKFFGTSQLSQFMDQTNPLAELTHKRRLSALGPGGLHRKRAGFEVRDVHHTHYGRICPIETPEGPNIGLITSLASYARVNEYGLIESPYRKVEKGRVTRQIEYLTADKEDEYVVAQANSPLDKNEKFSTDRVACRHRGDFPLVEPHQVDYMDISPMQVISVSTALIPFLEHDDANRALMGSNMQRQAVPLLLSEPPLVGTGVEDQVARDSGSVAIARRGGEVVGVDAGKIMIWSEEGEAGLDSYQLRKFTRSNQDTCINQVPAVTKGQKVKKGEVIADGPCTLNGELSLGKNLLVAFMCWEGYNFEDAILLSERLVREDVFTSLHVSEFRIESRDTKMGPEEITRDIPNVSADALVSLDESGIISVGVEVHPGDILVGKVTPKGEQQTTPEERLLKVIFGKKAEDVQDASLRVPPGVTGKILATQVLVRREKVSKKEENKRVKDLEKRFAQFVEDIRNERKVKMLDLEQKYKEKKLNKAEWEAARERVRLMIIQKDQELKQKLAKEKENLKTGDELPITVNKVVKVFIISQRKVQVGDKLAGRHGNKGVVAKILPQEDMPYLPDGTPVDIVLSPLSVPSRMNVGQLLETTLGWSASVLGVQMLTPVFDGATEEDILLKLREAREKLMKKGQPEEYLPNDDGKITLYDGRTGQSFQEKVTIGYIYVLKLAHLVEDKIHARSTGPYSLITRQPLGGKAQFGGQRFGEMEVWAIEGYGAAHILQEFLTVKSDDVLGRTKMYESIIKGELISDFGIPESFKVLVKELQALCLNVELLKQTSKKA